MRPFALLGTGLMLALLAGCQADAGRWMAVRPPFALDLHVEGAPITPSGTAPAQPPSPSGLPSAVPSLTPPTGSGGAGVTIGRVWGLEAGGEVPLAGATVWTTDGRQATTDTSGEFRLAGPAPVDGVYWAGHPGYTTSAVMGLDSSPLLHLKPLVLLDSTSHPALSTIRASGRVTDEAGRPLPQVLVMLGDAHGTSGNAVLSALDGSFTLELRAPEGRVTNGTLLAADERGGWLGMATGIALEGPNDVIDAVPATPGDDPLRLVVASHPVELVVGGPGGVAAALYMTAPDGTSLGLSPTAQGLRIADIRGARYDLRAEAGDARAETTSVLYRQSVPIDFAAASTRLEAKLLEPPSLIGTPALAAGETLAWQPVDGARGYSLSLSDGRLLWEGFSRTCALPWLTPVAGPTGLTLTAWDHPEASARHVASAASRQLRNLPLDQSYRKASRYVPLGR